MQIFTDRPLKQVYMQIDTLSFDCYQCFGEQLHFFLSHSLGNFITTAEKIRLPDDCTVGYIIEALLEVPLTHTGLFHSHLENLQRLPTDNILKQVRSLRGPWDKSVGIFPNVQHNV